MFEHGVFFSFGIACALYENSATLPLCGLLYMNELDVNRCFVLKNFVFRLADRRRMTLFIYWIHRECAYISRYMQKPTHIITIIYWVDAKVFFFFILILTLGNRPIREQIKLNFEQVLSTKLKTWKFSSSGPTIIHPQ